MANATSEKSATSNHLIAYTVKTIAEGRTVYTKIGAAFPHKEGPGFNLDLDALPVGGRIVCLAPKERDNDNSASDGNNA